MNWLERARSEICGMTAGATAETAEGHPTAATAAFARTTAVKPTGSIGSIGSATTEDAAESEAMREAFEERAAIMEFDHGMRRENAERAAWALVSQRLRMH